MTNLIWELKGVQKQQHVGEKSDDSKKQLQLQLPLP